MIIAFWICAVIWSISLISWAICMFLRNDTGVLLSSMIMITMAVIIAIINGVMHGVF